MATANMNESCFNLHEVLIVMINEKHGRNGEPFLRTGHSFKVAYDLNELDRIRCRVHLYEVCVRSVCAPD